MLLRRSGLLSRDSQPSHALSLTSLFIVFLAFDIPGISHLHPPHPLLYYRVCVIIPILTSCRLFVYVVGGVRYCLPICHICPVLSRHFSAWDIVANLPFSFLRLCYNRRHLSSFTYNFHFVFSFTFNFPIYSAILRRALRRVFALR